MKKDNAKADMKLGSTKSSILNLINEKVKCYISCDDAQEVSKLSSDIALLVAQYYIQTTPENKINGMFGSVYSKVLAETLKSVKKSGIDNYNLADVNWFIREYKDFLSKKNGELKRLRNNEGYSTKAQKDHVDKALVALYEKYEFPIIGRPGSKTDREDGLNSETVVKAVREMFATRPDIPADVVEREILGIENIVKNVHVSFDATAFDNGAEDDFQVSMKDKYAVDKNARDILDARRFIACALKFYGAINEPKFKKYEKHYITFRLVVARPSTIFMDYINNYEENILDYDWLEYLEECNIGADKGATFYEVLPRYIEERNLPYKLSVKTATDTYNRAYEDLLLKMTKAKEFVNLIY